MSELLQIIKEEPNEIYKKMVLEYKTEKCQLSSLMPCPNGIQCFNYHNPSDRRRMVFDDDTRQLHYDYHLCNLIAHGQQCREGELCRYAHNKYEINYHPFIYKLAKCENPICAQDVKLNYLCPGYHIHDKPPAKIAQLARYFVQQHQNQFFQEDSRSPNIRPVRPPLDLNTFKTEPCDIKASHNFKECIYYHSNKKDRRRDLQKVRYYPEPCTNQGSSPCDNEKCQFAHNKTEEFYHPLKFKTKYCKCLIDDISRCDYGEYCSFAHSDQEINIDLIHYKPKDKTFFIYEYKTVFCPYVIDHDRSDCVYAHNPQDFRRDPVDCPNIVAEQCEAWIRDDKIIAYDMGGCPKGLQCNKCHGWKEFEFHPVIFKTRPCSAGTNCRKEACPFYHNIDEKREMPVKEIKFFSGRIGKKRPGYLPFTTPKSFQTGSPVITAASSPPSKGPKTNGMNGHNGNGSKSPQKPGTTFSSALKIIKTSEIEQEEKKVGSPDRAAHRGPGGQIKKVVENSQQGDAHTPSEVSGLLYGSYKSTSSFQRVDEILADRGYEMEQSKSLTAGNPIFQKMKGRNKFSDSGSRHEAFYPDSYHQQSGMASGQFGPASSSMKPNCEPFYLNGLPENASPYHVPMVAMKKSGKGNDDEDKEFEHIQKLMDDSS